MCFVADFGSSDLSADWQAFYSDHAGMKSDYYRFWDKLSAHFAANPGVLGFDLFNEPL